MRALSTRYCTVPRDKKWDGGTTTFKAKTMQADIHPKYEEMKATCSCGNVIVTQSTRGGDIHVDVCSSCHPFYTGKQKVMDTGGRIDKFNKRFSGRLSSKS